MDKKLWDEGLATRRAVLGDEHVDRALATAGEFGAPLQELVTTYGWGWLWNRPGLDRRTRSFINLAMLSALNRPHEFKLHVRGALNNGLTRDEIREVLLQVSVYCGLPAGVEAHRLTHEVFREIDEAGKK